ncbi:nucleotidyltransferase family protein [Thalassotalea sp. Y01]|uniref:nucleotidyltransferase family protein n=1 Tax=Thalassotalea sp. Y01 TaxID=2729613 RepID=UPI00145DCF36|nr:nucleotidyltransferase family protein [Thalassotalea sp. Y01]NMP16765.1 nucleotidyltransferase family protein [Thalassotalea sp. Y01]
MMTDMPEQHVAIILAAGYSRRFGADKRFSGEPPLLLQTLATVKCHFDIVYLVHRHEDAKLIDLIDDKAIQLISAPAVDIGLGSSLAAAMLRITQQPAVGWVWVFLADMPDINGQSVILLKQAVLPEHIIRPTYQAQHGHPVGFSKPYFQQLTKLCGDSGAAHIIKANSAKLITVEVDDKGTITDYDHPEQLSK